MDRRENSYNSIGIELLIISKKNNNIPSKLVGTTNSTIPLHYIYISLREMLYGKG